MKRLAPCLVILTVAAVSWFGPAVKATPTWAPADSAAVHPGIQTYTEGSQCTANFVFTDGTNVYIGQAAHCASTGGNTETDGCATGSLPLGTDVVLLGASHPGELVYSSWLAMQAAHEADVNTCAYNDFALVRIDPADVASVNPSVPHWGGPVGLNTTGTTEGDPLYSYGNTILRGGVTLLGPKTATSAGDDGGGWTHYAITDATLELPGDSGSPYLDKNGNALGDMVTLNGLYFNPETGEWNGVSDLSRELAYARSHGFSNLQLVVGTESFNGDQVPLDTAQPVDDPVGGVCNFFFGPC